MNPNFEWNEQAFEAMAAALTAGATPEEALEVYRFVDRSVHEMELQAA